MKLLFILLLCPFVLQAQNLEKFKSKDARYSISYPSDWIQRDQKIPGHTDAIEFISPRHEGSVLVMTAKGSDCKDILKKLEKERQLSNVLKASEQAVASAELQAAHAKEGLRGRYEFPAAEKTQPVEQQALCLKKGSQKKILLGTYRKKNGPDKIEAILKSFSFEGK